MSDAIGELEAAWAEVEAALPEGWQRRLFEQDPPDRGWSATASDPDHNPFLDDSDMHWANGEGDTLAAALRALAAALRQR